MPIITLLTDFGLSDQYIAQMKGVICQLAPQATIVDVTHEIAAQDIVQAAFVLRQVWGWFPPDTIHLAVVDPGVGSARRVVACRYSGRYGICPDNGLISMVHHQLKVEAVHVVDNRDLMLSNVSATFHGRDIMAPVAAHLASGKPLRLVGPVTDRLEVLQLAAPRRLGEHGWAGEILCVDRFGNLISNISRSDLAGVLRFAPNAEVYLGGRSVGTVRTSYHEVPTGEPLALIGSSDYLEIAVNCGHAARTLDAKRGTPVELR